MFLQSKTEFANMGKTIRISQMQFRTIPKHRLNYYLILHKVNKSTSLNLLCCSIEQIHQSQATNITVSGMNNQIHFQVAAKEEPNFPKT